MRFSGDGRNWFQGQLSRQSHICFGVWNRQWGREERRGGIYWQKIYLETFNVNMKICLNSNTRFWWLTLAVLDIDGRHFLIDNFCQLVVNNLSAEKFFAIFILQSYRRWTFWSNRGQRLVHWKRCVRSDTSSTGGCELYARTRSSSSWPEGIYLLWTIPNLLLIPLIYTKRCHFSNAY